MKDKEVKDNKDMRL